MHTGTIKRIIRNRGFGFISDTDGKEVFFHRNSLEGSAGFESLNEGQSVEFEVENTPRGPNAISIRVV